MGIKLNNKVQPLVNLMPNPDMELVGQGEVFYHKLKESPCMPPKVK
jgi:hypothetical protein